MSVTLWKMRESVDCWEQFPSMDFFFCTLVVVEEGEGGSWWWRGGEGGGSCGFKLRTERKVVLGRVHETRDHEKEWIRVHCRNTFFFFFLKLLFVVHFGKTSSF